MNRGILYIVATPIGNLEDISYRAVKILSSVSYIACEDTRRTGSLLNKLEINKRAKLISYYDQTEKVKIPNILNILYSGEDVALVSDSGTPLISDPGYPLVRECIKEEIEVVSIPGVSAVISSLVSSGQPPDKFIFIGFLPKKSGNRLRILSEVKVANEKLNSTVIFYEAPHRLITMLIELRNVFGDINITLARELTKMHEEIVTNKISYFVEDKKIKPKGEYVILLNPKTFNLNE